MKDVCLGLGCRAKVAYPGDHFCWSCQCPFCHGDATQAESFEDAQGRRWCSDACNRLWHGFQAQEAVEA